MAPTNNSSTKSKAIKEIAVGAINSSICLMCANVPILIISMKIGSCYLKNDMYVEYNSICILSSWTFINTHAIMSIITEAHARYVLLASGWP